ncbi:hypothetical protein PO909_012209 [Leuciscus waleckii]
MWSNGAVAGTVRRGAVAETVRRGAVAETVRRGAVAETVRRGAVAETVSCGAVAETLRCGAVADTMKCRAVAGLDHRVKDHTVLGPVEMGTTKVALVELETTMADYTELNTNASFGGAVPLWGKCMQLTHTRLGTQVFEYDATSLVHPFLGSFSHSSLQNLSSSIRLDGKRRCTAIFRSLEMFNRVQVWALARPLKDIHRVVP